jgi:hypothetical protein
VRTAAAAASPQQMPMIRASGVDDDEDLLVAQNRWSVVDRRHQIEVAVVVVVLDHPCSLESAGPWVAC